MRDQASTSPSDSTAPSPYGTHAARGLVAVLIGWTRAMPGSWLGKRAGFLIRRIAIALLGGKPVDTESLGARFRLHPYNNVCEKRILFSPRDFDAYERDLLIGRLTPNFVFLDIGANIGGYSLALAAKAGPGARIVAFEPQPEIFERLIHNIRLNPFGNVKAHAVAIADRDGEVTLFLDPRNKGEASVKIVSADYARQVKVPARRLLSVVEDEGFGHIDAIKLDVEGAEDLILKRYLADAPEALWPRLIIVERGEDRWGFDLLGLLAEHGYRSIGQTRNNHILERGA
jgi:FkbM family methyltransferase